MDVNSAQQAVKEAARLFRTGETKVATNMLEQVQAMHGEDVVSTATALLAELPAIEQQANAAGREFTAVVANAVHELYFASRLLRVAIVRDWRSIWASQSAELISLLQKIMLDHARLLADNSSTALLAELCLVHSVIWKLQWGTGGDQVLAAVRETLLSLVPASSDGGVELSIVGRALVRTTIEEFGLYHPSAHSRGLTFAEHEACRCAFQEAVLFPVTAASVRAIAAIFEASHESDRSCLALVRVLYSVLCWRFNASLLPADGSGCEGGVHGFAEDSLPDVLDARGPDWFSFAHGGITSTATGAPISVAALLMNCFRSFLAIEHDDASQLAMQALVQFCSFSGSDWDPQQRASYADTCITALFELTAEVVSHYTPERAATLQSCCQGFHRLVTALGCANALFAHPKFETAFIVPLLQLTQAVIGHTHDADDENATESLDLLLRTWDVMGRRGLDDINVRCTIDDTIAPSLAEASATVVQVFLREKVRQSASLSANEEQDSETTHAQEYAHSHTQLIALLGRHQPVLIATFLNELLKPLMTELLSTVGSLRLPKLHLNEALWYLMTISAKFIGDDDDGEQPCIPRTIINLGQALEERHPDDEKSQESCNEVLQLTRTVCHFGEELRGHFHGGFVSPGVVEAVLLYCKRYVASYLFPSEDYHADFCNIYCSAFDGGAAAAEVMLNFCADALAAYQQDPDVLSGCTDFLLTFVRKPEELGQWIASQPSFDFLIRVVCGAAGGVQVAGVHRGKLFGFLTSAAPQQLVEGMVIRPVGEVLSAALQAGARDTDKCNVAECVSAMECVTGALEAIRTPAVCETVYPLLTPLVENSVALLSAHPRERIFLQAMLGMLNTIITGCGAFLPTADFLRVVEAAHGLLDVVSRVMRESGEFIAAHQRCNAGGRSADQLIDHMEDERVEILVTTAKLVLSVATWGLLDFVFDDDGDANGSGRPDIVAQFAVRGLITVINFCEAEVLEIPALRDTLFKLVQEVAASYTAEFMSVDDSEAQRFLRVIEFAVGCGIPETAQCGYGVMEAIAQHCHRTGQCFDLLRDFVRSIARTCAATAVSHRTAPALCNTLFAITGICGTEEVLRIFFDEMSSNALLSQPYQMLADVMHQGDFSSKLHGRRQFLAGMKGVLALIRGTTIL